MAAAAIGVGMSLMGGMKSARAEEAAARDNANMNRINADISEANAKEHEARYRRQVRRQMGSIRANIGSSGIQATGSALDVVADSAAEAELDALTIRHEGKIASTGLNLEAGLMEKSGRARARAQRVSAVGNALFSGAQFMDR